MSCEEARQVEKPRAPDQERRDMQGLEIGQSSPPREDVADRILALFWKGTRACCGSSVSSAQGEPCTRKSCCFSGTSGEGARACLRWVTPSGPVTFGFRSYLCR